MRVSRRHATLFTLLGCVFTASCTSTSSERESRSSLRNASRDEIHTAVGSLMSRGGSYCTAVLIQPRWMLTAAHCFDDGPPDAVVFDVDSTKGTPIKVARSLLHPRYTGKEAWSDIALVELTESPVGVLPMDLTLDTAIPVGTTVTAVGYGVTEKSTSGERRSGLMRISSHDEAGLGLTGLPAEPCVGDSGGPILFDNKVVGLISRGDPRCSGVTAAVSTQRVSKDFLGPLMAEITNRGVTGGSRCVQSSNCAVGSCVLAEPGGFWGVCGLSCTRGNCADGTTCGSDDICRPNQNIPGSLGSTCAHDVDCRSGYCTSKPGAGQVCASPCVLAASNICNDGFGCENTIVSGKAACFRQQETSEGCSFSVSKQANPVQPLPRMCFLLALFASLYTRIKRRAGSS